MSGHGYTYLGGYVTDNSTVPPRKEEWSKTSYTSDLVSQQVYVTKTEIVEVPNFVPGYKQSTPVKVDVLIDFGDVDPGKWNSSSNHVCSQEDKQYGPSSLTNSIQRPNPLSYHAKPGSGDQSKSSKEGQNPSGYTLRDNYYDPFKREKYLEPTMSTGGAWGKPSNGAGSAGQGANLSEPTSDINTAIGYLKEAVNPSSGITPPPSRYTGTASTRPKRNTYPETIDSKEAERRYGNFNFSSRPTDNYTRTIDSREAARKYRGTTV
ncbi:uncharacterized protein LOC111294277 [Durio zibethinus]|uniref:Uncharacterized protein LOC111294277 n=1 Tax=Durio zibethinus TaxID=66656 RepID=A0A6P5YSZ0_DURZI|nr:uncharacterized protein LOC111294277 [Durio zibethinus]XP_022743271.1 uncharacterized protein LOC111294277 [Durio zibethinus]